MTEERLKEIEARVTEAGCHALCDEALSPQEIKGNAAVWALVDAAPDFVAEVRRQREAIQKAGDLLAGWMRRDQRLRDALRFYAAGENYHYSPYPDDTPTPVTLDRGKIASAALAGDDR